MQCFKSLFGLEDWMRCLHTRWWFNFFFVYFYPYLGKIPVLTHIFQMGWNHQPAYYVYCLLFTWHVSNTMVSLTPQFCDKGLHVLLPTLIHFIANLDIAELSFFAKARFSRVYLLMLVWFSSLVIYISQHGINGGKDWNRSIHCVWRIFSINVSADRLEVNFFLLTFTYSMGSMDLWTSWSAIIPNTCFSVRSGTS